MDENTARLAEQLKSNPALLRQLAQSKDGQTLMRMLTQQDQGAALQKAAQSAALGDTADMVRMVTQLMQSPDGAALVERINKALRK